MELINEFDVKSPIEETWVVLTDLERIAPCMPGAQLQEVEGDEYRGIVKVKVGPITATFKGAAHFLERDADAKRASLRAEGRDTTGKGNAAATITAQLEERGADTTHVTVTTDLHITGKVAQFGRGALADVSTKLLDQFVAQLESTVLGVPPETAPAEAAATPVGESATNETATTSAAADTAAAAVSSGPRRIDSPEPAPVDLVGAAGVPLLKRLAPLLAAVGALFVVRRIRRRRRRSRQE